MAPGTLSQTMTLKVYIIKSSIVKKGEPVLYYLNSEKDATAAGAIKLGFLREELMIIPKDTEMPPKRQGE